MRGADILRLFRRQVTFTGIRFGHDVWSRPVSGIRGSGSWFYRDAFLQGAQYFKRSMVGCGCRVRTYWKRMKSL